MSIISRKICLLGDFAVGKTSLIRRFVEQEFSDQYLSTVGVKMSRKTLDLLSNDAQNKQEILFVIWDIEGSNKFKSMASTYFQGSGGAIIVGDITQPETIDNITKHIHDFVKINPKSKIAIALNKSDLIETEYLDKILKKYKHKFCNIDCIAAIHLTSAKTGNNVNQIFKSLASAIL